jgi:plastocyanin
MKSTRLVLAALVAFVTLLTGCGGGEEVGDESALEFDQAAQGDALGATTTTAAAAQTTTTAAAAGKATATTAAPTTTLPPEKQQVTIDVAINDDSPYFNPSHVRVLVGSKVRFINKGASAHSVVADTGAFDSGSIAPGAVWIYEATAPGTFNYSDGGRPFAVGAIEVVPS